jgi:phenylalanyl-tRNA synthetase beta chain
MCIGGVFGGAKSGVKDSTKNIFLESAHFNAKWIRRSSTRHDLRTDAARVFEKGSDPNICVYALQRAAAMMVELAGGEIASEVVDIYPNPIENQLITVKFDYVDRLIGMEIPKEKVNEILSALEMKIEAETADSFTVSVPTNKADVTRPADVVEEILRVFGLDNVPAPAQIRSNIVSSEKPDPNSVRNTIADYLAANGFNETMSLSLSKSMFYKEILPKEENELVFVNNTSNVELDIMRPTMLFSALEAVVNNQNRQQNDLKLFEFGKTYHPADGGRETVDGKLKYKEPQHLSLVVTGQRWPEGWRNKEKLPADFFTLKTLISNIFARVGLTSGYQETAQQDAIFTYALKLHRGPQELAVMGKVQPKVCKKMGIRGEVFYADLNWDALLQAAKKQSISFAELNKFPTVRRDLAVVIGKSVKFSDLAAVARKAGKKLLKDINLFDVFEDESKLGEGKKSYALGFTFEDTTRTLQDKEVDTVMTEMMEAMEGKLGAVIRR